MDVATATATATVDVLRLQVCDDAQSDGFVRPMPADESAAFLANWNSRKEA